MNNRYTYALVDGNHEIIIETEATVEQFELAIKFAKTLLDYNNDDVLNVLRSANIFAEYISVDRHFDW